MTTPEGGFTIHGDTLTVRTRTKELKARYTPAQMRWLARCLLSNAGAIEAGEARGVSLHTSAVTTS